MSFEHSSQEEDGVRHKFTTRAEKEGTVFIIRPGHGGWGTIYVSFMSSELISGGEQVPGGERVKRN